MSEFTPLGFNRNRQHICQYKNKKTLENQTIIKGFSTRGGT